MKRLFLILAIVGAVIPYVFFVQQFGSEGLSLVKFINALFVNPVASGFTADLLITSVVFWIMMFYERRKEVGPSPYIFIALNLLIGLSCALPAYLYARELQNE